MSIDREIALIERSKRGDQSAFALLIGLYKDKLFGYLFKFTGDRDLAKDWMQDVLIKTWKGIKKYNDQQKFASWLFSIAHNTAIDGLRKLKRTVNETSFSEIDMNGNSETAHDIIIHEETKEIINKIVDSLPHKQKEVFVLRMHAELPFKEIAEIMKEPMNTVLSHMHYAVKKLRKEIGNIK
jgi:RNA polymerase sigma-70 factor (ECF subfamily)